MTLGALIGAGADPDRLRDGLAGLSVGGYRIEVGRKIKGAIEATDVCVVLDEPHPHHHRRLKEILETIRGANLSDRVSRRPIASSTDSRRPKVGCTAALRKRFTSMRWARWTPSSISSARPSVSR